MSEVFSTAGALVVVTVSGVSILFNLNFNVDFNQRCQTVSPVVILNLYASETFVWLRRGLEARYYLLIHYYTFKQADQELMGMTSSGYRLGQHCKPSYQSNCWQNAHRTKRNATTTSDLVGWECNYTIVAAVLGLP